MRVPLSWLADYVEIADDPETLAEILTNAGLEVKGIERYGVPGAAVEWDPELVVMGRVLAVEEHPDADRLVIALVEHGAAEPRRVVTGAPNLLPLVGDGGLADEVVLSPLLLEGGVYRDPHDGGAIKTLKGRKLRGIYNDAMLCSAVELGLGDDHSGVLLLRAGDLLGPVAPGTPAREVLGDVVLDIDIIPNIARCASMIGVAREVAALTEKELRLPSFDVEMEGEPLDERVVLEIEEPELNPRFVALLIEGVEQKPSPYWLQHRLELAGQRAINAVVDVSNYVMLEVGQPNHTFDFDTLRRRADEVDPEGPVRIRTRLAEEGETLVTLDGKEHRLRPNNILVTDPLGNLSLGGVMGGENSEIQDDTTDVLLEAAAWNFINIRQTTRQLGIHTEAAFRFSRGVHPSQAMLGARRAAELLRVHAGGRVARGIVDAYPLPPAPVEVEITARYINERSGVELTADEIADLLRRLEFEVEVAGESLTVVAPDHRLDIEGPHDLLEEVCRVYGYANIPSTVLHDVLPPQRGNAELDAEERLKDLFAGLGLREVISYRLTTAEAEARCRTEPDERGYLELAKPSTADRVALRHSVLASVLESAAANSRFADRIALFELGHVFLPRDGEPLPDERRELAFVLTGRREPEHFASAGDPAGYDVWDGKGLMEEVLDAVGVAASWATAEHPSLRPGRAAVATSRDGALLAHVGELDPRVVAAVDLRVDQRQPVIAGVLDLEVLLPRMAGQDRVEPVPVYPSVFEDLALVVDDGVPAGRLGETMRQAGGELLKSVALFDVYRGAGVPEGRRSLAFHLEFQASDRTLEDRAVERLRRKILAAVEREHGAELRA